MSTWLHRPAVEPVLSPSKTALPPPGHPFWKGDWKQQLSRQIADSEAALADAVAAQRAAERTAASCRDELTSAHRRWNARSEWLAGERELLVDSRQHALRRATLAESRLALLVKGTGGPCAESPSVECGLEEELAAERRRSAALATRLVATESRLAKLTLERSPMRPPFTEMSQRAWQAALG